MMVIGKIAHVVIALGIFNVWLLQFHRPTAYRGKGAVNMRDEFAAYGLPVWFMWLIGGLKLALAVGLIAGFWIPTLVLPCGIGMAVLMVGAIAMHFKVGDQPIRCVPALIMLLLSIVTVTV